MEQKKILWGVCGIGNGHTFRQWPLIQHFADAGHRIVIFAYGESYDTLSHRFAKPSNVTVERVAVPYYVGNAQGLNFEATAKHPANQQDFATINARAMANAERTIGKPDLVISDYEPTAAQYAYAHNAPLVTIDQQSKYLAGQFPETLNGQGYKDEVMRLRMFFPKADKRIATTFFRVPPARNAEEKVDIMPPVLRDEIIGLKRHPRTDKPSLLVYLTAQQALKQPLEEMLKALESSPAECHIFLPPYVQNTPEDHGNLHFYRHGDKRFEHVLAECNGIVTTAGHTLLSEAMHLGIPVYAMPLDLYEQQMNAQVIAENGFGVMAPDLTSEKLADFIQNLSRFAENIEKDTTILLRNAGQPRIIEALERSFLQSDTPFPLRDTGKGR